MAYTIDRYSGVTLTTVEDGTVDQTTDIKLVGKNYAGYGEIQNENFLHLLENFSGTSQPPKAISGQIWFDATASKLKFYDGSRFRTTGGAEVSATQPAGLASGDLWWDSTNQQLYAYSGSGFVLIGPQGSGTTVTQMKSVTIRDVTNTNRLVIQAIVNDEVIFMISAVSFTIDSTDPSNAVTGFDVVKKGITLRNTMNATGGVTSTTDYYWGTASNSLKLGGFSASDFALAGSGSFTSLVNFADAGVSIGDSNDLKIFIENDNEGVIQNQVGTMIKFKVDDSQGAVHEPVRLESTGLHPSLGNTFNLGKNTAPFSTVHATSFSGTATQAATLQVGANFRSGSTAATNNTVAVRDGSGNLVANLFTGTATQAQYADLAEKYTTSTGDLAIGTIVAVADGLEDAEIDAELKPCEMDDVPVGVISEKPAFLMNAEAEGQAVALKGRVPVRTTGPIFKGKPIYANVDGIGTQIHDDGQVIGIALETKEDEEEKLVEVLLKV
tara:strand:+ start:3031 stop:4521 length:1491 start_codon:yes stop_codon:yes gene_type:complete